jgi:hypothetical protein
MIEASPARDQKAPAPRVSHHRNPSVRLRAKGDDGREHFEARLNALREMGGDGLLVPESPALGGFGYASAAASSTSTR